MNGQDLIAKINSPSAVSVFNKLYGGNGILCSSDPQKGEVFSLENVRLRYTALVNGLIEILKEYPDSIEGASEDVRLFTAAGRTELGGNHTDHNNGKVLAASIQLDAVAAVVMRNDKKALLRSTGFPDVKLDITDLAPKKEETGTTESLVRGIAAEFAARGIRAKGFIANADSTVLKGSGLSSSAAIEVLLGTIFNCLYSGRQFNELQIAQFGQKAENNYFGKPSGLMDQAASASGGVIALDFAVKDNPKVEKIDFDPAPFGYALCVVDTRGSHADLTPDYAAIPNEMQGIARFFGKGTLREINIGDIYSNMETIRQKAGDRAVLRCLHYFNENRRVQTMTEVLKKLPGEVGSSKSGALFNTFLGLVNESGNSSWELLQNVFSPRNPAVQSLALALALSREFFKTMNKVDDAPPGVCRVHGGGFAGTIQVYIRQEYLEKYKSWMEQFFGEKPVTVLRIRHTGTTEIIL
jgi:galactokinase